MAFLICSRFIGLGEEIIQREGVGIVNRQFLGVGEGVGRVALVRQVGMGATVCPEGIGQGPEGSGKGCTGSLRLSRLGKGGLTVLRGAYTYPYTYPYTFIPLPIPIPYRAKEKARGCLALRALPYGVGVNLALGIPVSAHQIFLSLYENPTELLNRGD